MKRNVIRRTKTEKESPRMVRVGEVRLHEPETQPERVARERRIRMASYNALNHGSW